jgi:hypothetical protein
MPLIKSRLWHQLRVEADALMNHLNDTNLLLTALGEPTSLARQFTMGWTAQIGIIVHILAGFQHTH